MFIRKNQMLKSINGNDLLALGYLPGRPVGIAIKVSKILLKKNMETRLKAFLNYLSVS